MAAPLIVATVGGAESNSYLTLEEADAWFADGLRDQRWTTFSDARRTQALIEATRMIEALPLIGRPYDPSNQALHFPRTTDLLDGALALPAGIVHATAEQALYLLETAASPELLDRRELQRQGVQTISLDGISESYRGGAYNGFGAIAWDYLRPFVARTAKLPTRGSS